jgi:chlorite dismutase
MTNKEPVDALALSVEERFTMADTVHASASDSATAEATAPTSAGRPASSYGAGLHQPQAQSQSQPQTHDPSKPAVKRQIVCFSFYKVMPEWRRLPAEERAVHKAEFAAVLAKWNRPGEFVSLTYSTVGTRGDVDMCVWSIGYDVDELNQMRSELLRTPLGGYLNSPHNFLAMTKRSQYQIGRPDESEGEGRGAIRPGGQKYIFIYPFWKTRPWYLLPITERKRLMDEHIRIGLSYPRVKLNTTYSFGIDDQEFVVAFETNFPEDFVDLVQQLRETEISMYTLKDTPIFSCVRVPAMEMLDRLG